VVELSTLAVGVAPVPVPLLYGTNHVAGRDGVIVIETTRQILDIECGANSFYHSDPGVEVCKAKALVTPTPATLWVRTNQTADIDFTIDANYPVVCTAEGGMPVGSTVNHSGTPASQSYTLTTTTLVSSQVVELTCMAPGLPASQSVTEIRINVLPETQEI